MPGQRAVARADICICRGGVGGIVLTHLALVAGAGGVQQLGGSDVRPHAGRGGQEASKGRKFQSISPGAARHPHGPRAHQSPLPGSTAGAGLVGDRHWAPPTPPCAGGSGVWGGFCSRGGRGSVGSGGWAQGKAPAFHPCQNAGLQLSGRRAGST